MKLINNYLNTLETYLPEELCEDVRAELEVSIQEQLEEQQQKLGRELNEEEQEQLLQKVGHPGRVAAAYLPNQQLIGSDYFPSYKKTLKTVLSVVLAIVAIITVPFIFTSDNNLFISLLSLFWDLVDTGITIFTIVTVIYYVMQKENVNPDSLYDWSAKDLDDAHPKLSLSKPEVLFEFVVELAFLGWWNNILTWPATLLQGAVSAYISFSPEWQVVFMPVNVIMGASALLSLHKLVLGSWTKRTLIGNILLNFASLYVMVQIAGFDHYIISDIADAVAQADINWQNIVSTIRYLTLSILGFITVVIFWELYSDTKLLRRI